TCCRASSSIAPLLYVSLLPLSLNHRPPASTLFPYTTLFRSLSALDRVLDVFEEEQEMLPQEKTRQLDKQEVRGELTIEHVDFVRSEEHTSELQSREKLVCRLLLEKKKDAELRRVLLKEEMRE